MEFVAKKKILKVTIDGVVHEMRYPVLFESDALQEQLQRIDGATGMQVYYDFFERLGLPQDVQKQMDMDDYLSFIQFVLTPKKKS